VRAYLALGEGGLMVDGVQDDGLAAACGLQPDDIVTKIGGRAIASPDDVAAALGAIRKGAEVRVEFVRRGRPQVATTPKRHDAPAGRAPLPRKVEAPGPEKKLPKKLEERR
jgi:S1-C subfamily serine protease